MLTTPTKVVSIPGLGNNAPVPTDYLNMLISAADTAIKKHCKLDLELTSYVEFYNGKSNADLYLRSWPLWVGTTTIAVGSNGAVLPQATINVTSTANFPPGTTDPSKTPPTLTVQTGITTFTTVTYTGTTATSFTGCSGGTGTLSSAANLNAVFTPTVWIDPNGFAGQNPGGFPDGALVCIGTQFYADLDRGGTKSNRAILKRVGAGSALGFGIFGGYYANNWWQGRLAGMQWPGWPMGQGNVKVAYTAGYSPIPDDLSLAASMLVGIMIRNVPTGSPLASENLGGYAYSLLNQDPTNVPEIGSIQNILAKYREASW